MTNSIALSRIFEGWEGYQASILKAVRPLTAEQLAWRPGPQLRSTGEVARHIALGRVDWFARMDAPGSREVAGRISAWDEDAHGNRYVRASEVADSNNAAELAGWLEATWGMIEQSLAAWTVDDLWTTYRHTWRGDTYAISRHWTIWRIMAHDIHHGGELSLLLGMQGIEAFELGGLGGHLTELPLAE
jgi:uncharacterized damage-inducible protein DinB